MASVDDHLARAASNLGLAEELAAQGRYEWAITVLYYAAVHHAGALLSRLGVDSTTLDHNSREYILDRKYTAIVPRYLSLQGQSRRCRYMPNHSEDAESWERARRLFAHIENYCTRVHAGKVPGL